MDDAYLKLIHSGRVNERTRKVLLDRLNPQAPSNGSSTETFAVLTAVVDRLIPQSVDQGIVEIAQILVLSKRQNIGDGWRFANMPPDYVAFETGLVLLEAAARHVHGAAFKSLSPPHQDALLKQVQSGEVCWTQLDGRRWFEDLLADATAAYVSHPFTLARMGFSGIAFLPRWPEVGLQTTQVWEPGRH